MNDAYVHPDTPILEIDDHDMNTLADARNHSPLHRSARLSGMALSTIVRLKRAEAVVRKLQTEAAEEVEDRFRCDAMLIKDGDRAGWWDTMALSHVMEAGDRLVELGEWERHPDGYGRRGDDVACDGLVADRVGIRRDQALRLCPCR